MAQKSFSASCCPVLNMHGKCLVVTRVVGKSLDSSHIVIHPLLLDAGSSSLQTSLFLQQALLFSAQPLSSKRSFLLSPKKTIVLLPPSTLDVPTTGAGQPTLAGSCLTALSCGLPGCGPLPPASCCLHPALPALCSMLSLLPAPCSPHCLHPAACVHMQGLGAVAPAWRYWHLGREWWEHSEDNGTCFGNIAGIVKSRTVTGLTEVLLSG